MYKLETKELKMSELFKKKIRLALITMDMSETKKRCSKDIFKFIMNSSNEYIHNFKNDLAKIAK